jgi:hypothetical protein
MFRVVVLVVVVVVVVGFLLKLAWVVQLQLGTKEESNKQTNNNEWAESIYCTVRKLSRGVTLGSSSNAR